MRFFRLREFPEEAWRVTLKKENFFYAITSSTSNPDRAAVALVLASTALDAGHDVLVWFVTEGALLARRGAAEKMTSPVFGNLNDLIQKIIHFGGHLAVCGTCCAFYKIDEKDFADGFEKRTAAWAVESSIGRNCLTF